MEQHIEVQRAEDLSTPEKVFFFFFCETFPPATYGRPPGSTPTANYAVDSPRAQHYSNGRIRKPTRSLPGLFPSKRSPILQGIFWPTNDGFPVRSACTHAPSPNGRIRSLHGKNSTGGRPCILLKRFSGQKSLLAATRTCSPHFQDRNRGGGRSVQTASNIPPALGFSSSPKSG